MNMYWLGNGDVSVVCMVVLKICFRSNQQQCITALSILILTLGGTALIESNYRLINK